MKPTELEAKFSNNPFILVSANDSKETIKKYGKGVLFASSREISLQEINKLISSLSPKRSSEPE
jgi:hypothetical protein